MVSHNIRREYLSLLPLKVTMLSFRDALPPPALLDLSLPVEPHPLVRHPSNPSTALLA
jgi:hypothetical protein